MKTKWAPFVAINQNAKLVQGANPFPTNEKYMENLNAAIRDVKGGALVFRAAMDYGVDLDRLRAEMGVTSHIPFSIYSPSTGACPC